MVPCLVSLTDLQTRRAGLSALAELLVRYRFMYFILILYGATEPR